MGLDNGQECPFYVGGRRAVMRLLGNRLVMKR